MSSVYFQIGTNNGNDLFRNRVRNAKPDLVILVEPNKNLISRIKDNYRDIENVHIYDNAIYYNNDEEVTLYVAAKNGIMGTVADNGVRYTDGNFSLLPMNDWGDKSDMVKIVSKSITFDKICENHNITQIDFLQIDTEGFDSEIIKMIDLQKYKIKKIRFEQWNFTPDCFERYHKDLSSELGKNGMAIAINKLKQHNYDITYVSDSDGNDVIATLME
jgi:FkbM family methyltransferase